MTREIAHWYSAPMRDGWVVLTMVVAVLAGCATNDHDHGDGATDDGHHVRDPAVEPCGADNWRALVPDLRQCELTAVVLDGESLRRADLSDARLAGASLAGADLFKAVLHAGSLAGANLAGAKLTSADLTDADLTGVSLIGATLTNATFTGAVLEGVTTDATTICPAGTSGPCW